MNCHGDPMALGIARCLRRAMLAVAIGAALVPAAPVAAQDTVPALVADEVDGRINGREIQIEINGRTLTAYDSAAPAC